jgi:hypothetical protein
MAEKKITMTKQELRNIIGFIFNEIPVQMMYKEDEEITFDLNLFEKPLEIKYNRFGNENNTNWY